MNLDNPKNIWEAVSTLIDKAREQDIVIEMLKAKIEVLELTKADRVGRKPFVAKEEQAEPRRRGRPRKKPVVTEGVDNPEVVDV